MLHDLFIIEIIGKPQGGWIILNATVCLKSSDFFEAVARGNHFPGGPALLFANSDIGDNPASIIMSNWCL